MISTQAPRSITAILKEHKRRYGDNTKDTAKKFFGRTEATTNPKGHQEASENKTLKRIDRLGIKQRRHGRR